MKLSLCSFLLALSKIAVRLAFVWDKAKGGSMFPNLAIINFDL